MQKSQSTISLSHPLPSSHHLQGSASSHNLKTSCQSCVPPHPSIFASVSAISSIQRRLSAPLSQPVTSSLPEVDSNHISTSPEGDDNLICPVSKAALATQSPLATHSSEDIASRDLSSPSENHLPHRPHSLSFTSPRIIPSPLRSNLPPTKLSSPKVTLSTAFQIQAFLPCFFELPSNTLPFNQTLP